MRSSAVVDIGLSWSAPSHTLSSTSCGAHALICCREHRPLVVSSLPHTLSHLPAVVLMRSSTVVDILLSWSAPSPTHSLIYQLWGSCAHLLSWASSSRGLLPLPTHSLSSTSCDAHALICCRGHRPLEVCSLPHRLSHLPAVVLMRTSAIVGILLSWSAPSPTLSHLLAVVLMRPSAIVGIGLSRSAPSPTLFLIYQQWCSCAHLLS